jgi:hypothetical protein
VLEATCVWRISDALVIALDNLFGEPVDAYVNGSQVWLRDDGPGDLTIEWRMHPVAGYVKPKGVPTSQLFGSCALALSQGLEPIAPVATLWDGLEGFAAYGDEISSDVLRVRLAEVLGIAPDLFGMVDHETIGDAWEHAEGKRSVIADLIAQLDPEGLLASSAPVDESALDPS